MIGAILTIGLGICAGITAMKNRSDNMVQQSQSVKTNKPYYIGHDNKWRSTETNEIVTMSYCDPRWFGHDILIGCTSKRVYVDYTKQKIAKANEEAKANGKKFIWREYPFYFVAPDHKTNTPWRYLLMPFDPEKELPYDIEKERYSTNEKRYIKTYYKTPKEAECLVPKFTERLSDEEFTEWDYGFFRSPTL